MICFKAPQTPEIAEEFEVPSVLYPSENLTNIKVWWKCQEIATKLCVKLNQRGMGRGTPATKFGKKVSKIDFFSS